MHLRLTKAIFAALTCMLISPHASAAITSTVRGLVHDPLHRPIANAPVSLQSSTSALHLTASTDNAGLFTFTAVPVGQYTLTIQAPTFAIRQLPLLIQSGASPILHFELSPETLTQNVTVRASEEPLESAAVRTTISRQQIERYPGADSTNSLAAITDFLAGATVVHDQLHVRGGHQVTWAIDGVPIPNTNIATNLGPQFNPKDIDYLELQSGGYTADSGDRTYGVFNVAPRTGFERNHEAEFIANYGNYNTTDDQLSYGDHSERAAWYISLSGNRTDHGLETPTDINLHNQSSGGGAFTSLVWNRTPSDQIRGDAAYRADFYQVPLDPSNPLPDREREQDAFATASWLHTFSPGKLLTLSPFFHFNRAAYEGASTDVPTETDNRASTYAGGQAQYTAAIRSNDIQAGLYGFAQFDKTLFALTANDGSSDVFRQTVNPNGALFAAFADDQYTLTRHSSKADIRWLTLTGGFRFTRFSGNLDEIAASPRLGAALRIPFLGWTARATYSRFYQAPPLDTVSGPLAQYALQQGLGFLPLHGERDEQHEFGLGIPLGAWSLDLAAFRTAARNYFDHDAIGNSNLFLPLTIDGARIQGYEATVHSPLLFHRLHTQLVYSNQRAQGYGAVTGGLTDFSPPEGTGFYLDHDQRNTLAISADAALPYETFAAINLNYGSGFLNGDGPSHLPQYATLDLSLGKDFTKKFAVRASATNLTNTQYQLDLSNTFGGSHYGNPRMFSLQLRYRFSL